SALDLEAYRRGTSVYYADQVIPMLPKELSNGICSLNPDEVRLTFSALITLKLSGEIEGFRFVKSYIRSRVKGVYSEINQILDGNAPPEITEKYHQLIPQIQLMQQLAKILRARRFARGAMNISSNESKFIIKDGRIQDIVPRPTGESERMIEEFMLTANEAAATLAMREEMPFVYRVHEQPPVIKVNLLHDLLTRLGVPADRLLQNPQPKDFADILEGVRGTELEPAINGQLLRTMSKAVYSERNIGHFGLVLENYAHFTSPIRRYPDLTIHRILTSYLAGMPKDKLKKRYGSFVPAASKNSSEMEVNAMNIERDCEGCYKAEYMSSRIGERFVGRITGVASYGFYVELANSVEGMVSVHDLPMGDYQLDEGIELKEQLSGKVYRIGQQIEIQVASVDVSAGQVNFVLPQ
ncbi:RNB domain-containing ribonuclease, partial [uncultured Negativibacillus sp.]|uniref:ribonuclease R family protein n=1 Tax=uncultured Negativibacillus sp. TaxID=1980696 RepID=UPI0025D48539